MLESKQKTCKPGCLNRKFLFQAHGEMEKIFNSGSDRTESVGDHKENFPQKYKLKLKHCQNGNLLTIHHTISERYGDGQEKQIRIRLGASCFNAHGQYVVIDKRGHVFVFDFAVKQYWKMPFLLIKARVLKASINKPNIYLLGTKSGTLHEFDTEKSVLLRMLPVCRQPIDCISYLSKEDENPKTIVLQAGREAILIDLVEFVPTHRLDFEAVHITLKFASFIPNSDEIFACFTNDSVHVWSASSLKSLRTINLIKNRDRKLKNQKSDSIKEFNFGSSSQESKNYYDIPEYSDGNILSYCFSPDGNQVFFGTSDCYLLVMQPATFEFIQIYRLNSFVLKQCTLLSNVKEQLLLGLTYNGKVLLLDLTNHSLKFLFDSIEEIISMCLSEDSKLLSIMFANSEAQVWSTMYIYNKLKAQQQAIDMLKSAAKEEKTFMPVSADEQILDSSVKKFLNRTKIKELLREYQCFPSRFRCLLWHTLLDLPGNYEKYQELLKRPVPFVVEGFVAKLKLKNDALKKSLTRTWSCLAHWSKVLGHCDFLPHLIFPFIKLLPKHTFIAFEIIVTLILNHFYLWFEMHPLPPANYIGITFNILQDADPSLCKFFMAKKVESRDFTWSLLENGFSEVLDDDQWAMLWDHIMFNPPYFIIFCVVAYNIIQREIIMRLPDKQSIQYFFHEQNPIDLEKMLSKTYGLISICPKNLHPSHFIKDFQPLPKKVYPMFLNYPKDRLDEQEARMAEVKLEQKAIDARIRQLELEEIQMMSKLQEGLKEEEEAKRLKEMERMYQEIIKREEERVATQRKLLLLYQKEFRQKKNRILNSLEESQRRKNKLLVETELEDLRREIENQRTRHECDLMIAEEEMRNRDLDIKAQKFNKCVANPSLANKYQADLQRLRSERHHLNETLIEITHGDYEPKNTSNLDEIEKTLDEFYKEFSKLKSS